MNARETAWRMFAGEINYATFEKKGDEEKAPSYVITPLGTMVNRVLVAGTLTDLENSGTEEEPMWKGKIEDVSGNYFFSAGRFQPEASAALANLEPGVYVAAIAKVRTFTTSDGRTFVSLRPERIMEIDEERRRLWILEAAQSLWDRLLKMRSIRDIPDLSEKELLAKGFTSNEANGLLIAFDIYGVPSSEKYLKLLQNSLRMLLPDEDIDFGIQGDTSGTRDEIDDVPVGNAPAKDGTDKEAVIIRLIDELDCDSRGASMEEIISRAESEGITCDEVEMICNDLSDKGLIYEPNLGFFKNI